MFWYLVSFANLQSKESHTHSSARLSKLVALKVGEWVAIWTLELCLIIKGPSVDLEESLIVLLISLKVCLTPVKSDAVPQVLIFIIWK